jgi:hypothetical protein
MSILSARIGSNRVSPNDRQLVSSCPRYLELRVLLFDRQGSEMHVKFSQATVKDCQDKTRSCLDISQQCRRWRRPTMNAMVGKNPE